MAVDLPALGIPEGQKQQLGVLLYPEGEILELARSIGIARITMGSDAHRPGDVGSGLDICRQAALEAGFTTVNVWRERQAHELPIKV